MSRLKLKLHHPPSGRRGVLIWSDYYNDNQAQVDDLITFCTGRFTEIIAECIYYESDPKCWMGDASMGRVIGITYGGKTPLHYMIDEAAAAGIGVMGWVWGASFNYLGGANGLMQPMCPDNATYDDSSEPPKKMWNFHNATARTLWAQTLADFATNNPGLHGFILDIEQTTANIVPADLTLAIAELRSLLPVGFELLCFTGASLGDDLALKFDVQTWLDTDIVDGICFMGYNDSMTIKRQYVNAFNWSGKLMYVGAGNATDIVRPSDFGRRLEQYNAEGYRDVFLFGYRYFQLNPDFIPVWDAYIAGTLATTQAVVTKLSAVTGVSFSLTIGGAVKTTLIADVGDHVNGGSLKGHIEVAEGATYPRIYYTIPAGNIELEDLTP